MKKIIFDLGNVLFKFHPEEFLSYFFDTKTMEDLMIIIFCSDEWLELDLGNLTMQEVIDIFSKRNPQYEKEITFVLNNWSSMLIPIEKNVRILKKLKEMGYPLYILSNFHKKTFEEMKKKHDFLDLFDGGIVSAYEHIIKPDERIYKLILERYHLKAEECLFIDDSLTNIHVAQHLGIDGIHLKYGTDLKEELTKKHIL